MVGRRLRQDHAEDETDGGPAAPPRCSVLSTGGWSWGSKARPEPWVTRGLLL